MTERHDPMMALLGDTNTTSLTPPVDNSVSEKGGSGVVVEHPDQKQTENNVENNPLTEPKEKKRTKTKASGKRQNEFAKIFQNELPAEERLIADFSCALVRDILVQGRLYLTENYCCFHSTILRWETSAIIPYIDISNISKERTVKIIPNAISVHCNQNKYIFTSFTARDRALLIFKELWRLRLDRANETEETKSMVEHHGQHEEEDNIAERISNTSQHSEENDHEPAPLYDEDKNSKVYLDAEFPVPVDTLFSLLWLPSSPFWSSFMTIRKTKNWSCDEWSNNNRITRECRCIQHIQLPMGSTKDVPQVDEHHLVLSENSRRIVVDARTYIRDVPYGDSFHTLNRWQFLRSSKPNTTRLRVSTTVCYEKQCWQIVRNFIEKGAYEGNCAFMNELREELGRFIENGSVSAEIPSNPGDDSGAPLTSNETTSSRTRSESKISVRPSTANSDPAETTHNNLLDQQLPNLPSGLGIDHAGALQHWMLWLFFFFVGVMLFSNWSLHSRLNAIESKLGLATDFQPVDTGDFAQKPLVEISELLRALLAEVKTMKLREGHTEL